MDGGILVFARQANACAPPYEYYQCSKGPFTGCCAIDPCNEGVCPQEYQLAQSVSQTAQPNQATMVSTFSSVLKSNTAFSPDATSTGDTQPLIVVSTTSSLSYTTTAMTFSSSSIDKFYPNTISSSTELPTSTTVKTDFSTKKPNNLIVIIGSVLGGLMGVILILLALYLWRRQKALNRPASSLGDEKQIHNRASSNRYRMGSDFTLSSSWNGPFEKHNDSEFLIFLNECSQKCCQKKYCALELTMYVSLASSTPFTYVNRTRSSKLNELDSSPVSPMTRSLPSMNSSDTIFELDSGASPYVPSSISTPTLSLGDNSPWVVNGSNHEMLSQVSSSTTGGGVRLASTGHSSTKSNTPLDWKNWDPSRWNEVSLSLSCECEYPDAGIIRTFETFLLYE